MPRCWACQPARNAGPISEVAWLCGGNEQQEGQHVCMVGRSVAREFRACAAPCRTRRWADQCPHELGGGVALYEKVRFGQSCFDPIACGLILACLLGVGSAVAAFAGVWVIMLVLVIRAPAMSPLSPSGQ